MNICERLEDKSCKDGVDVIRCNFKSPKIKGLYCNGTIGISNNIKRSTEKACVLAEELGHHHTTVGNIIDLSDAPNRKQERQARLYGYNLLIGLRGLIDAYENGCKDQHDAAEYLDVTEEYLQECIDSYRDKYGIGVAIDNYYIMFIPHLAVGKII